MPSFLIVPVFFLLKCVFERDLLQLFFPSFNEATATSYSSLSAFVIVQLNR